MKRYLIPSLALLVVLSSTTSCSYNQYGAITSGASLGAVFGSSIGGLMGGPRGSDKGTLAGVLIGAAAGAAVSSQIEKGRQADVRQDEDGYATRQDNQDVEYGTYNSPGYRRHAAARTDLEYLEVTQVRFLDANNNQCLDSDESAFVEFDIYNRADHAIYNVSPQLRCNSRKVLISPAAIIESVPSGRGVRYKAAIRAPRRLPSAPLQFTVSFGTGKESIVAREFSIRTGD